MTRPTAVLPALLFIASTAVGAQQPASRPAAAPPAPAPAPGSAGIYKNDADLTAALKKAIASISGDTASSSIANTDEYRVNIVYRNKPGAALSHRGNTELHYVIDGAATIVTGGTIVRPPAGSTATSTIENGETRHMKKGDVIIVPAGSAHWYKEVEGTFTYLEVRFVAPEPKK